MTVGAGSPGAAWTASGPYGGAGYGARYNPATGVYTRGGYAYGPGGGVAWRTGYNPSTGVRGAQRGGYNAYGSWKQGMVTNGSDWIRGGSISGAGGTLKGFQTSGGAAGIAGPDSGFVVKGKEGNVYAGKDGNVYRRDQEGNWSQLPSPKGGASASTNDLPGASTRPSIDSGVKQGLDSDYSSRQSGNARTNSWSSGRSYGGGRSFGGGGRRR